jgi:ABC-type branched-subunit amino acid transport system ATPase component/ABC-type branched-subunit amino acid transport system permease subunit
VYRSNRFLNLAHAQLGALSAQLLAKFVLSWGWSWWAAFVVCVPIGIGVGLASDRFVVGPLRARHASTVSLLLVTLGVTQVLLGLALFKQLGPSQAQLVAKGYPVPFSANVHVGGVVLDGADLMIAVLVPLLVLGLAAFLRYTLLGTMIRAAASNPDAARLAGVSTARVSAITWGIAGGLSAITAVLQGPSFGAAGVLDITSLGPELLLFALGAAALGAFTSIPGALAGGIVLGLADQIALSITSNAGTAEVTVFVAIIAIVLVRGAAIGRVFAATGPVVDDRGPIRVAESIRERFSVHYAKPGLAAAALALAVLAPLVPVLHSDGNRFQLTLILVYALVAVSLSIAIGWAGQISLGQFALVGAGAFVAAHLIPHGWSIPLLVIACGAVGALVVAIVGLPALRIPGFTLAVTTLGFAVVAPDWLFHQAWFGSSRDFGIDLNAPNLVKGLGHPSSALVTYYVALALVAASAAALWGIRRSPSGRLMIAVRDNEAKSATFSVTPATVKVAALSLSGFIAGSAGVLWADAWRTVSAGQFGSSVSLSVLAAAVIGGTGSVGGALAGAVLVYGSSAFLSPHLTGIFGSAAQSAGFQFLFGGVTLIGVLLWWPKGIAGGVQNWWQHRLDLLAQQTESDAAGATDADPLVVDAVEVSFDGVKALDGASIRVGPGEIVGLIGPNGAGKTTLLNVISGALPARGAVHVCGVDVSGHPPELRAARGLSRSFQQAILFPGLTVTETIQVALRSGRRVGMLASGTATPWARAAEAGSQAQAREIVDRFGLTPWADRLTGDLSTGTRRICDLAAQVAAGPRLLLLDEPTGGVAQREAEAFGPLLKQIRAELGCSILLIEHDMPLLMSVCDRIYAMETGAIIAEGTPAEIRANPAVIASYLGTSEVAITRSGTTTRRRRAKAATK